MEGGYGKLVTFKPFETACLTDLSLSILSNVLILITTNNLLSLERSTIFFIFNIKGQIPPKGVWRPLSAAVPFAWSLN